MNDKLEQVLNFVASELAQIDAITDAMVIRPRAITIHIDDTRILVDAAERTMTAEAALAAVPAEALRRTLLTGYRTDAQITADADAINAWLGGGQP